MRGFFEKFQLEFSEDYRKYFDAAKEELARCGTAIMDFEQYHIYTYMAQDIAEIRNALIQDEDNVLYCYFLNQVLHDGDRNTIRKLCAPCAEEKSAFYDTLPLFALLWEVPRMIEELQRREIPQDVIDATCNMFENQVQDHLDLYKRYGIACYTTWMLNFLQCKMVRIGRFNFEMCRFTDDVEVFAGEEGIAVLPNGVTFHKSGFVLGSAGCEEEQDSFRGEITETDDCWEGLWIENGVCRNEKRRLPKDRWRKVLTKGDSIISVHIPSGGPLDSELCSRDIARCREVISQAFGTFKAFYCSSWLLSPTLKDLLNGGNLLKFSGRFELFPQKSAGEAVYEYVYSLPSAVPAETLPEKTSLARAVKKHLLNGGKVLSGAGVFL